LFGILSYIGIVTSVLLTSILYTYPIMEVGGYGWMEENIYAYAFIYHILLCISVLHRALY